MVRFEDLQDLWQHQQPLAARTGRASLTRALARYSRRLKWINLAKMVMVVVLLSWGMARSHRSIQVSCCLGTIGLGAIVFLALDWRNQQAISRLNFAEPSAEFVRKAIERLLEQREPYRKYYWPFVLFAAAGFNLMLLAPPNSVAPPLQRLLWHVVFSAMPFAIYELGRWVRARRFEAEARPLLDRLTALQQALEEHPE